MFLFVLSVLVSSGFAYVKNLGGSTRFFRKSISGLSTIFSSSTSDLKASTSFSSINSINKIDDVGLCKLSVSHQEALSLYSRFSTCQDEYLKDRLSFALTTLHDALRLYSPTRLFASFNGGKDAVVILHLLRAASARYCFEKNIPFTSNFVYFEEEDEFEEVRMFINKLESDFDIQLKRYNSSIASGLKEHLQLLYNENNGNNTAAFVLGTRKGDPGSKNQQTFSPSSWDPPFMRVNPILDWEYGHVWHFLRLFELPYCSLYDQGYTSLGKTSDTEPNPHLLKKDFFVGNNTKEKKLFDYHPAYMLTNDEFERAGRKSDRKKVDLNSSLIVEKTAISTFVVLNNEFNNNLWMEEMNFQLFQDVLKTVNINLSKVVILNNNLKKDVKVEKKDDANEFNNFNSLFSSNVLSELRLLSQRNDFVFLSSSIGNNQNITKKMVLDVLGNNSIQNSFFKCESSSSNLNSSEGIQFVSGNIYLVLKDWTKESVKNVTSFVKCLNKNTKIN